MENLITNLNLGSLIPLISPWNFPTPAAFPYLFNTQEQPTLVIS